MNIVEIPLPLLRNELSAVSFLSCIAEEELSFLSFAHLTKERY